MAIIISMTSTESVATLALGSLPKQGARGCKVTGQEGSLRVMPHAPGSARECEGIDPHIPKGTRTLGIGVLVDSRMFRERLQGSKTQFIEEFFISLEIY